MKRIFKDSEGNIIVANIINPSFKIPVGYEDLGYMEVPDSYKDAWEYVDGQIVINEEKKTGFLLEKLRSDRDELIEESDKMMYQDRFAALSAEEQADWIWYRQQLRDLPEIEAHRLENAVIGSSPSERKSLLAPVLAAELSDLQASVAVLQAQITNMNLEMPNLEESLDNAIQIKTAQATIVDNVQEDLDALSEGTQEYSDKEAELATANASLATYTNQVTQKQAAISDKEAQIAAAQASLAEKQAKLDEKQAEIDNL